ncbi:Mannosylfructose-phosphate synthase [Porphyromonas macacae]|uniref:Mannosylfructose-phosphate synthase n=1 Tax=Porphyromonas macacae TaxID=28115 RepID=A0A379E7Y3_9PORP|nr:glycosyltransferase [Porphyromonas macacae]SUB88421.1 Mannosylfructose-phosphate synthase [Porphyromonas macacae]
MKNILFILPTDSLGGAEQVIKQIAKYHIEQGDFVDLIITSNRDTQIWESIKGIHIYYLKGILQLPRLLWKLPENKRRHFDRVYTSHAKINVLAGILRKLNILKTSCFIARESTSIFVRFKGVKRFIYKIGYGIGYGKIDLLICQTEKMKESLCKYIPHIIKQINIITIPNPIDKSFYSISQEISPFRFPYIISAGRMIPEKGFDILIKSYAILNPIKNNLPNLVILGDGPLKKELKYLVNSLGIENKVFFPGFQADVKPFFKNAELCVISSRIEGFPNVLLQMMSQNEKIICSLCAGGIGDIKGIAIIPINDVESLAEAIKNTLSINLSQNRFLFDRFLSERSITNFMEQIDKNIQ